MLTPEQKNEIVRLLQRDEPLSPEWSRILFPPERREYELAYQGKERLEDVIAGTIAVPLQPVRTFPNGHRSDWENMLVFGDNLQVLKSLIEAKRSGRLKNADGTKGVRLVYIDPPFGTKQDFQGSRAQKAYQDRVVGARFLEFLRRRLILIREVLSDDGAIVVHADWKKGHYIKVLLDEIFGESRFRNEIIWWYYNKMQGNVNRFPSNHETLFYYTASDTYRFTPQFEEREGGTTRLLKRMWDSKKGKLVNAKDKKGRVLYIETDEKRLDDVWRLSMLQPADRTETVGYPTQKPELLLAPLINALTAPGDLVMDCFAGSGTTLAVAEKLGRRWVGVDCGKLSIYTIQKRLLNLRDGIGNDGRKLTPKPFTLFNAGLYDFSTLRALPWESWRFFALQLFECRDEPHEIGGIKLDGYLKGASVLVFNHLKEKGVRIDEDTIASLHEALGSRIGARLFIIAPAMTFDFQQDYIEVDGIRYYALRIPYSIINELHQREFTALRQPSDELEVNATVESVGFDFIKAPDVKFSAYTAHAEGKATGVIRIDRFNSDAVGRSRNREVEFSDLSMVMLDLDCEPKGQVFELDMVFYAEQLAHSDWEARFPLAELGERVLAIFIDIYGNESRVMILRDQFGTRKAVKKTRGEMA